MDTFTLYDYKILSTGVDGGHRYLTGDVIYKGLNRKLVIFFKEKSDENNIIENAIVNVEGHLLDEGLRQSLVLNDAILMNQQIRKDKEIIQLLRRGLCREFSDTLLGGMLFMRFIRCKPYRYVQLK